MAAADEDASSKPRLQFFFPSCAVWWISLICFGQGIANCAVSAAQQADEPHSAAPEITFAVLQTLGIQLAVAQ